MKIKNFFLFLCSAKGKAQPVIQLHHILPRPKATKRKCEDGPPTPRKKLPVVKTKVPGALKPPEEDEDVTVTQVKRGRGRPRKSVTPPKPSLPDIKVEPQGDVNVAVKTEDIKQELEIEEIPQEKIVPVLALLDIENEILQEMTTVPENLRTVYYFEQRFEVKLEQYFGITDKQLVRIYVKQVGFRKGDEMKVGIARNATKHKVLYMIQSQKNAEEGESSKDEEGEGDIGATGDILCDSCLNEELKDETGKNVTDKKTENDGSVTTSNKDNDVGSELPKEGDKNKFEEEKEKKTGDAVTATEGDINNEEGKETGVNASEGDIIPEGDKNTSEDGKKEKTANTVTGTESELQTEKKRDEGVKETETGVNASKGEIIPEGDKNTSEDGKKEKTADTVTGTESELQTEKKRDEGVKETETGVNASEGEIIPEGELPAEINKDEGVKENESANDGEMQTGGDTNKGDGVTKTEETKIEGEHKDGNGLPKGDKETKTEGDGVTPTGKITENISEGEEETKTEGVTTTTGNEGEKDGTVNEGEEETKTEGVTTTTGKEGDKDGTGDGTADGVTKTEKATGGKKKTSGDVGDEQNNMGEDDHVPRYNILFDWVSL